METKNLSNNATQVIDEKGKKSGNGAKVAAAVAGTVAAGAGAGYVVSEYLDEDATVASTTENPEQIADAEPAQEAEPQETPEQTPAQPATAQAQPAATSPAASEPAATETTPASVTPQTPSSENVAQETPAEPVPSAQDPVAVTGDGGATPAEEPVTPAQDPVAVTGDGGATPAEPVPSAQDPVAVTDEDVIITQPVEPDPVNPDDIAEAIISAEEVDPNDNDMADVFEFDSVGTVYTSNGEVVTIANMHDEEGNELAMVDVDGDSQFDHITTADGSEVLGSADGYTVADAEMEIMGDDTYLAQNELDNEIPDTDFSQDMMLS